MPKYLCPECYQELDIISYPEYHNEYRDLHLKCEHCGFRTRKVSGYKDYGQQRDKLIEEYNIIVTESKESEINELFKRVVDEKVLNLKNAFDSGKWFKRPCWDKWWRKVDELRVESKFGEVKYLHELVVTSDIIANDYEVSDIVIEWFDIDISKKYPNGVLCWVRRESNDKKFMVRISEFDKLSRLFIEKDSSGNILNTYSFAEPVKQDELPANYKK